MSFEESLGRAVLTLATDASQYLTGINQAKQGTTSLKQEFTDLEKTTAAQPGILGKIAGALGPVGIAMAGAFTVTAVIAAGKKVIDFSSNVTDLAARLGTTTDWVQRFQMAFGPAGVPIEKVSAAIVKLNTNVLGGDKSAVKALQALGLSLDELAKMSPEQRFLKVADAIGTIPNQSDKAFASIKLFGKGGAEVMQGFTGHLEETIQGFDDMGLVIDQKTIKAADSFGDQLGMLGKQLLGILANVLGPLLPALSTLGNLLGWIGSHIIGPVLNVAIKSAMTLLSAFMDLWLSWLSTVSSVAAHLPIVGKQFAALSEWSKKAATDTRQYMTGLWTETAKVDTTVQATTPTMMGFNEALDKGTKASKAETTALDQVTRAIQSLAEAQRKAEQERLQEAAARRVQADEEFGAMAARAQEAKAKADAARAEMEQKDQDALDRMSSEQMQAYVDDLEAKRKAEGEKSTIVTQTLETMRTAVQGSFAQMLLHAKSFHDGFLDVWGTIKQGVMGILTDLLGDLTDRFLKGAINAIKGQEGGFSAAFKGAFGGFGGVLSGLLGSLSGWAGAAGAIIAGVAAAFGAVKKLFGGGEEGTVVNPARDAWFAAHGGLAGVNEAAFAATGNLGLSEAIFAADTKREFNDAIAAWSSATNRIVAGDHLPGFASGTGGRFLDFGAGTTIRAHGKERITTEAEGRADAAGLARLEAALEGVRNDWKQLPYAIGIQLKAALAQA